MQGCAWKLKRLNPTSSTLSTSATPLFIRSAPSRTLNYKFAAAPVFYDSTNSSMPTSAGVQPQPSPWSSPLIVYRGNIFRVLEVSAASTLTGQMTDILSMHHQNPQRASSLKSSRLAMTTMIGLPVTLDGVHMTRLREFRLSCESITFCQGNRSRTTLSPI